MKIKDLIKELKSYDQNAEIHLSSDIEGNSIKTVHEVAELQDGHYEGFEKDKSWEYNQKHWVETEKYIVIYPTDTCVSDNA